ncbi:MAG: glycine--tRNA ligase subunit beta [Firmicutes bacterium]|nr:glycine--tRNA ligase subunit beta [Bacillota bacterium]
MDKRDLLFEIGVEEIPARFLPPTIDQLQSLAKEAMNEAGLPYEQLHIYATPRRLTILVKGLTSLQADSIVEAKGPSLTVAYDKEGKPSRALQGFCKGQGINEEDVQHKKVGDNLYVFAVKEVKGQKAVDILPQILESILFNISFPKPMRWGYEEMRFARPIHWLVALWGTDTLPLCIAGISADRFSRGHRNLGSQMIKISEPQYYLELLRQNFVICDQQERRELVWKQIQQVAASLNGMVKEDRELLEEVVFLLEYPTAFAGAFDEKYLDLPAELIITPMREHQRYFPVYNEEGGLLNRFIAVRNGDEHYLDTVRHGNERVIHPRLADAAFFWQEDLQQPLDTLADRLGEIVFHEKLGDMKQKTQRLRELSAYIGSLLGYSQEELYQTERAASLAKADLLSHVVYEFPELQGIMGSYYAQVAGEDEAVACAIREHYLPRFAKDELPLSKPAVALALADRIDSLAGFFAVGLIPSGSQDPFALRRAATGCVQIMVRHGLFLSGKDLMKKAFSLLKPHMAEPAKIDFLKEITQLLTFLRQRIAAALNEEGLSYDVIQAMENQYNANIFETILKARALHEYRNLPGFDLLLTGFTRADNLLRSAAQKGDVTDAGAFPALREELLQDDSEKQLYERIKSIHSKMDDDLRSRQYKKALEHLAGLSVYIDNFFAAVMVMDKDRELRHNRLALLKHIVTLAQELGDLSRLVEKEK